VKVPMFDLKRQYAELREELLPALDELMSGGHFILGENVAALEREVAALTGTRIGIGVANGTDALNLALLALGIGPGDEVIVPSTTFFATAGSVARTGARPVFADVDENTFNVTAALLEPALTKKTRAVIPVHLFGQAAPMEDIMELAREHGLKVVEDAAQAIGATRKGRPVCSFGDCGCLSFFPTKNLGAYGDAGMVVTSDHELAERTRLLRVHGSPRKYHHVALGYNSRLDEVQALILRIKLKRLGDWAEARRELARNYTRLLTDTGLVGDCLKLPRVDPGNVHVFHQYTLRVRHRDDLRQFLEEAGVGTSVYYPLPLHLQPIFRSLGYEAVSLPVSERLAGEVLSLPMFPELEVGEQEYVVDRIARFYRGRLSR